MAASMTNVSPYAPVPTEPRARRGSRRAPQPPLEEVGALVRQRIRGGLALAQAHERVARVEILAQRQHRGDDRSRALPARATMHVDPLALVEPRDDGLCGRLDLVGRQAAVVDELHAALLDARELERGHAGVACA